MTQDGSLSLKMKLKNIVGLFFPVWRSESGKYGSTISIGNVPLGWIMVVIAIIVHVIMERL